MPADMTPPDAPDAKTNGASPTPPMQDASNIAGAGAPPRKGLSNGQYFKIMGYLLTAGWVGFILAVTGGDTTHPLFDYIFAVPLAGWIAGMIIGRIWRIRAGTDRP